MNEGPLAPAMFGLPAIRLAGTIDQAMYASFRDQLGKAPAEGLVVVELSTLGGDPEVARTMGADIRFQGQIAPERRFVFLGKAAVYSAGVTFMGFFPRADRYLMRGTRLMIHERRMASTVNLDGPLTRSVALVKATLNEIEASIAIQNEGFAELIDGSKVTMEELLRRAPENWYLEAAEARSLGLVADVI